jgi:archaellum biogenesis protein FlaJ (TadC family)
LAAFAAFRESVEDIAPSLTAYTGVVASCVLACEWTIVALLLVPGVVVAGFVLAAFAVVAFSCALIATLRRHAVVPCRCFGSSARPISRIQIGRNAVIIGTVVVGAIVSIPGGSPMSSVGAAVGIAGGIGGGLILILLDDLADLFGKPVSVPVGGSRRS